MAPGKNSKLIWAIKVQFLEPITLIEPSSSVAADTALEESRL